MFVIWSNNYILILLLFVKFLKEVIILGIVVVKVFWIDFLGFLFVRVR